MFLRLYPSDKLLEIPVESLRFEKLKPTLPRFPKESSNESEKQRKMALSPKSLAGPGYIILNGIRVMNVIGLLAVIIASIVMLVRTSANSHFFFFDAVSHVLTAATGMFLLISELSLFRSYFARNWPLLSPTSGFVTLAIAMLVLGVGILGNLNKDATSQESLGLAFWQIVIASGIVVFILGWVNLVASFIFRDRSKNISARQVRAHGAVAVHKTPVPGSSTNSMNRSPTAPELAQSYIHNPSTPSKSATSNPFRIRTSSRRESLLPSYYASTPNNNHQNNNVAASPPYPCTTEPASPSSKYSRTTNCTTKVMSVFMGRKNRRSVGPPLPVNVSRPEREMEISAPAGVNPQFAHLVQRPDSALHPSRTGESETHRWRAN